MRKILAIAWASLLRMGRDRTALLMFLVMPMILIGILGVSLGGLMSAGRINPFTVIVVNEDQPARAQSVTLDAGKILLEEFFGSERLGQIVTVEHSTDLAGAKEAVLNGKAVAAIHVPRTFSADILAGRQGAVGLFTDPGMPTQAGIINQVLHAFTDHVTANALYGLLLHGAPASEVALPEIREVQAGTRTVKAVQYYAAAMAVMFMLMSAVQRAGTILQDRENGTLARILVSPTPKWMVLTGQTLATAFLVACQFLVLLVGSTLIYRVYWGAWLPVLLIGFAFAVASAGLSTGMAAIFREPKSADAAIGLVSMVFGALSGSMLPLYTFPDALLKVAKVIPNYWALQGLLDQMAGVGAQYAWLPVSILCIIGIVAGALGSWRLANR
ncbi:MAG TPA: ABC transporter permease [Symbiobacteriaceae bacterium]|nr:ABC transporter permease [Symbiobacteriaceae bacterium]